ncbi:MAG: Flp family type IVb pilin [Nitrospinae bacterium]|nr:Flp family type IVb pilin [Nitrospinota bacterium]
MLKCLKMFMNDQDGATATEYALLIGLIAAVIILTVQSIGVTLNGVFGNFDNQLSSMVSPSS